MTMDRRTFLRNSALVGAGVVAADQLDLLDRPAGWTRKWFAAWGRPMLYGDLVHDDTAALQYWIDRKIPIPRGNYMTRGVLRLPDDGFVPSDGRFVIRHQWGTQIKFRGFFDRGISSRTRVGTNLLYDSPFPPEPESEVIFDPKMALWKPPADELRR